MMVINILVGAVTLLFGRKLYWLFVAIAGFLFASELARSALSGYEPWIQLLVAIAAGVVGAVAAMLLQRVGFAIAGFLAGGYFAAALFNHTGSSGGPHVWMLVGGVLGAIVAAIVMDWALIALSSLVGAAVIAQSLPLEEAARTIVFVVLVLVGLAVQGAASGRPRRARPAG